MSPWVFGACSLEFWRAHSSMVGEWATQVRICGGRPVLYTDAAEVCQNHSHDLPCFSAATTSLWEGRGFSSLMTRRWRILRDAVEHGVGHDVIFSGLDVVFTQKFDAWTLRSDVDIAFEMETMPIPGRPNLRVITHFTPDIVRVRSGASSALPFLNRVVRGVSDPHATAMGPAQQELLMDEFTMAMIGRRRLRHRLFEVVVRDANGTLRGRDLNVSCVPSHAYRHCTGKKWECLHTR